MRPIENLRGHFRGGGYGKGFQGMSDEAAQLQIFIGISRKHFEALNIFAAPPVSKERHWQCNLGGGVLTHH